MTPRTLKHHRRGESTYRFAFGGQAVTVSRRFLPGRTALRVRVTSTGREEWTDYRDYPDMHEGDAQFSKQAQDMCRRWESRYLTPKKETTVTEDPTPTQNEGDATATPAQVATGRTGVQHVVGDDGRTLCKAQTPDRGKEQPRVLGEYTFTLRGPQRPSRTGEMARLLKGVSAIVGEASRQTHLLNTRPEADDGLYQHAVGFQVRATYFKSLWDAGFDPETNWDELVAMVTPLRVLARSSLPDGRAALDVVNGEGQRAVQRSLDAAELFLAATQGVASFWEPREGADEEGEEGDGDAAPLTGSDE